MAKDNQPVLSSDALDYRFELAQKGRAFWLKHHLDAYHRVLLLPESNGPLAAKALDMLGGKQFLPAPNPKPLAILTAAPAASAPGIEWITAQQEELESLIMLYSMYEFTDRLMIVSYDLPCGRKLYNLLETGVAEEKELLADVLLGELHGKDA